jgi:predicted XRE-type DNA-binding protein
MSATLDTIVGVDLAYRETAAEAERVRENRNRMIRDALNRKQCTQREIAKALGLSAGRVGQIATAER